ncbi:MAG: DUF2867 domain-containing protein [Polyangiaceae bacterium]|nr:DUF2867 domain-containing protein [Polyangiaceae bacterium]
MSATIRQRSAAPSPAFLEGESRPIDYLDTFSVVLQAGAQHSVDYLTAMAFTSTPRWAGVLMRVRDLLVSYLGLKGGDPICVGEIPHDVHFEAGERAVYFEVLGRAEDEIVMGERDRHLDFRVSVRKAELSSGAVEVAVSTAVWFNNALGKGYFALIRPFHRAIMAAMLLRFAARLAPPTG